MRIAKIRQQESASSEIDATRENSHFPLQENEQSSRLRLRSEVNQHCARTCTRLQEQSLVIEKETDGVERGKRGGRVRGGMAREEGSVESLL